MPASEPDDGLSLGPPPLSCVFLFIVERTHAEKASVGRQRLESRIIPAGTTQVVSGATPSRTSTVDHCLNG